MILLYVGSAYFPPQATVADSMNPQSSWDEKVLPVFLGLQHERDEHVHSQELLTAELTSRSGWVRIIHGVQTLTSKKNSWSLALLPPILPSSVTHPT